MAKKRKNFRNSLINPDKFHVSQIKFYIILAPLIAFMSLPIIFIINHAFKPLDELMMFPPRFFTQRPTTNNFIMLFRMAESAQPASVYLFNTLWITAATVFASVVMSVCAGYVLSKVNFRGRETLFKINQISMMFVPIAVMIPRYLVIAGLGILDTPLVHILPLMAMPVGLFLVKQFIDSGVPDALVEAAKIDGASDYFIVWKIITPLIKPAISTLVILSFQMSWSATEASAMFIERESLRTFAFLASSLVDRSIGSLAGMGVAAAAALFMFVPSFIVFMIVQSGVMNTMSHSGIK